MSVFESEDLFGSFSGARDSELTKRSREEEEIDGVNVNDDLKKIKSNRPVWSDASILPATINLKLTLEAADAININGNAEEEIMLGPNNMNVEEKGKKDLFDTFSEQIIETIESEIVLHEVCFPPNFDVANEHIERARFQSISHRAPAKKYPFTLDPFQQRSIDCLERRQSVLVAAHTSAGKTVVAEYAIAMALRDTQRVIYTSPIKALSNQKYRELHEEFSDVGLMTGDVTISPSASCLVMTTEILRNMLYRGAEIMREVGWIIFDEIHYLRDKERGVVWEEVLILLPSKVKMVFLSATLPNASEFASWVAKLHSQPCNVVYTDYRPTPLQHYLFPQGGEGIYLVVDEKGNFREDNFQKALTVLTSETTDTETKKKKSKGPPDMYKILKMIVERNYTPVIVFSFSKRDCETHATNMAKLDLSSEDEKKLIGSIFSNAIDSLSEDDKKLPQVQNILPLLKRGIGIHHSGLLPILKEVVEILFQEGLLKALFSTETFSMGLNMPAKTVVFTSIRKFDGEEFRVVTSGEYIQMSGRAGRRGLDDRGIVVLMLDEKLEPSVAKAMLKGASDKLNSSFHLGYNMLLNLLRVEEADPTYMIKRSFHQFQALRAAPEMQEQLKSWKQENDDIVLENEESISEYYKTKHEIGVLEVKMLKFITDPLYALTFLNPGRLIWMKNNVLDWGWGIVVNFSKLKSVDDAINLTGSDSSTNYIVDVLISCDENSKKPKPGNGELQVVPFSLSMVFRFSSVRINISKDLKNKENKQIAAKNLKEVLKRFNSELPSLDPIEDMKIKDTEFLQLVKEVERYEYRLEKHPLVNSPTLKVQYELYEKKVRLQNQISTLNGQINEISQSTVHKGTLRHMKRVLKKLGFISSDGVVTLKGRVACEISTVDELLATEMIYGGIFNTLTTDQVVSLVSCLVYTEKSDDIVKLKDELMGPLKQLQDCAKKIAKVSTECGIPLDETDYLTSFKPHIMEITNSWARGAKFVEIMKLTSIFEGSVIRALRRLEEVLRQFSGAARIIGNAELEAKFDEGISKIKRDVVFSSSLFL